VTLPNSPAAQRVTANHGAAVIFGHLPARRWPQPTSPWVHGGDGGAVADAVMLARATRRINREISAGQLVAAADGDRYGVLGVSPQGPVLRIVGERAAAGVQVVDRFRSLRGISDLVYVTLGEQDGQGRQVGHDLILTDIGVFRPGGAGAGGAAVAVSAPVGRAAGRKRLMPRAGCVRGWP